MRSKLLILTILAAGTYCFHARADQPTAAKGAKPGTKSSEKTTSAATPAQPAAARFAADEAQIRQAAESYVKAFNEGNAKGVADHFAPDAEYVDAGGAVTEGRAAIEKSLAAHFARSSGNELSVHIATIRFLGPSLAIEDGSARITRDGDSEEDTRYTAVHVKTDGKWLMASVRDHADRREPARDEQLKQLEWMVGDWVSESSDSFVEFSCHPIDGGSYLIREFTIRIAGRPAMSGSQRIGWDPLSRHFRIWTFDSKGGYLEGLLSGGGNRWVLRSTGQSAEGEVVTTRGIFTSINPHTMTWQNVEYVVNGIEAAPADPVRIVRKAPRIQVKAK